MHFDHLDGFLSAGKVEMTVIQCIGHDHRGLSEIPTGAHLIHESPHRLDLSVRLLNRPRHTNILADRIAEQCCSNAHGKDPARTRSIQPSRYQNAHT